MSHFKYLTVLFFIEKKKGNDLFKGTRVRRGRVLRRVLGSLFRASRVALALRRLSATRVALALHRHSATRVALTVVVAAACAAVGFGAAKIRRF